MFRETTQEIITRVFKGLYILAWRSIDVAKIA